jgi:chemotaxis protein MotA
MDLATVIGIVVGFSLVIIAMATGGGIEYFVNAPSAMIVLGGTTGAILVNYPLRDVLGVMKVAKNAFVARLPQETEVIAAILFLSRLARRQGMLSLEAKLEDKSFDPFLKKAIMLVIDGLSPEEVRRILLTEIEAIEERHRLGADIFSSMGNFAPAMGLMGTLIGLVNMLIHMNDPAQIGPSMAIALITTFYGVILANLVFLPIAGKLRNISAQELLVKELIIEGVFSIQAGDNPRILEQKLNSFISPTARGENKSPGGRDEKKS